MMTVLSSVALAEVALSVGAAVWVGTGAEVHAAKRLSTSDRTPKRSSFFNQTSSKTLKEFRSNAKTEKVYSFCA